MLNRAATTYRNHEATVDTHTGERRTWGETQRRAEGVATALTAMDLDAGDRVGVLMLNSARHLELWFAIPAAGMVMNDLNYRLAVEELRFICDDSGLKVLFVDDNFLAVAEQLLVTVPSLERLVWVGQGSVAPGDLTAYDTLAETELTPRPDASPEDLAAIFYTGGTTGLPKGAMLTHRNLTSNALHVVAHGRLTTADTYLHAGPQFHLADGAFSYAVTWTGGRHVFIPAFDPAATATALANERCTMSLLVPTMITMVLASGALEGLDLDSLRLVVYGASPMPSEVQRRAAEAFGCGMAQAYGMTEASPVVSWLDEDAHVRGMAGDEPDTTRLRSAGVPVLGVQVEVRREDGTLTEPGEAGEIFIRGANIMGGYWNRDEETAHALVDGWYRSGDVAYTDDAGYLFVVDRAKDMIISGGENVYTSEVENAIYAHPAVAEAAVFGIPHEEWGETVHAEIVVKPNSELTSDELIESCRQLIAGYKVPRSVALRSADDPLPKSGAGKILKREMREPFWVGRDRQVG